MLPTRENPYSQKNILSQFFEKLFRKGAHSQETITEMSQMKISPPLRPPQVLKQIGNAYELIIRDPHPKFGFARNHDYLFSFIDISMYATITYILNQSKKQKIAILHIGTGDLTFARRLIDEFGEKIDITILSPLQPIQKPEKEDAAIKYITGNTEYFFTLFPANMFDIIFSAQVFSSFADPLGTLLQLYEALVPSGLLCIDSFQLPGIMEQMPQIYTSLNTAGYKIIPDYIYEMKNKLLHIGSMRSIIIKKTLPQLIIPGLTYKIDEQVLILPGNTHAVYAIDPPVTPFHKELSIETEAFLRLIKSLLPELSEEKIISEIFNTNILNNPLHNLDNDGYAKALQISFDTMIDEASIPDANKEQIQYANKMIPYVGKWIESFRNRQAFLMQIRENIGLPMEYPKKE